MNYSKLAPVSIFALSIVFLGWTLSSGLKSFQSQRQSSVTVKGLAEEFVKSDFAIWKISFKASGKKIDETEQQFNQQLDHVRQFLQDMGFGVADFESMVPVVEDLTTREYQHSRSDRANYQIDGGYVVRTVDVDKVRHALGQTTALLKKGIMLTSGGHYSGGHYDGNPKYLLQRFNEMRPALLQKATQNARAVAEKFSSDAGAKVGRILNARQGVIETHGADGGYHDKGSIEKKLRVVSTFTFALDH